MLYFLYSGVTGEIFAFFKCSNCNAIPSFPDSDAQIYFHPVFECTIHVYVLVHTQSSLTATSVVSALSHIPPSIKHCHFCIIVISLLSCHCC